MSAAFDDPTERAGVIADICRRLELPPTADGAPRISRIIRYTTTPTRWSIVIDGQRRDIGDSAALGRQREIDDTIYNVFGFRFKRQKAADWDRIQELMWQAAEVIEVGVEGSDARLFADRVRCYLEAATITGDWRELAKTYAPWLRDGSIHVSLVGKDGLIDWIWRNAGAAISPPDAAILMRLLGWEPATITVVPDGKISFARAVWRIAVDQHPFLVGEPKE